MGQSGSTTAPSVQHVAFDRATGRILHSHSRFSVEHDTYVDVPEDELRRLCASDATILEGLTDRNPANLEFLKIGTHHAHGRGPMMVDVARGVLVLQPRLSLSADKREIDGDGQDNAQIAIEVLGANGRLVGDFQGRIKLTTSRGRLSARGGMVDLVDGKAEVTLTSSAETVSRVQLRATAPDALCADGQLVIEFV